MYNLNDMVKNLLEEMGNLVQTKTVVGEPIQAGDSTVIPVSKVSFGFAGGGGSGQREKKEPNGGTGMGGGANIEPIAFIVITKGKVQMLSLKDKGALTPGKVIDLIPELIEQVKGFKQKKGKKETGKEETKKEEKSEK